MSKLFASVPKYLVLFALVLTLAGVASAAPILFPIDPQAGFLRTSAGDIATTPYFIDLSAYGAVAGDTLILQSVGGLCYGTSCSLADLIAAFTLDTSVAGQTNLTRLNAAALPISVSSIVTGTTWPTGDPTDIAQDFEVPNASTISVVVPTGALYLAVGVYDSWYDDNSSWTFLEEEFPEDGPFDPLGIEMQVVSAVPEPGTILLLASGLGLLGAFWRKRKA